MKNFDDDMEETEKKLQNRVPKETRFNNNKSRKYFESMNGEALKDTYKMRKNSVRKESFCSILKSEISLESMTKNFTLKTENNREINLDEFDIVLHSNPTSRKEAFKFKPKSSMIEVLEDDCDVEDEEEVIEIEKKNTSSKTSISQSTESELLNLPQKLELFLKIEEIYNSIIKLMDKKNYDFDELIYSWFQLNSNEISNVDENYKDEAPLFSNQLIYEIVFFGLIFFKKNLNEFTIYTINNCLTYLHRNTIILMYRLFQKSDALENENFKKSKKKLDDNKSWLNSINYNKLYSNNSLILNGLIKNLIDIFKDDEDKFNTEKIMKYVNFSEYIKKTLLKKSKDSKLILEKLFSEVWEKEVKDKSEIINKKKKEREVLQSKYYIPSNMTDCKYTLVLDLDETLVHYVEDDGPAYILIRPGAEDFLEELSQYYEIIVFTAATQDYADFVLNNLDKKSTISHRLYRQHTIQNEKLNNIKDLSKLGRDLKKTIIIDNVKENFQLQPENGIHIKDFIDDPNDSELNFIRPKLVEIAESGKDDIRQLLIEVRYEMESGESRKNQKKNNYKVQNFEV